MVSSTYLFLLQQTVSSVCIFLSLLEEALFCSVMMVPFQLSETGSGLDLWPSVGQGDGERNVFLDIGRKDPLWPVCFVWSHMAPVAAEEEEPPVTTRGTTLRIVECRGRRSQGHRHHYSAAALRVNLFLPLYS